MEREEVPQAQPFLGENQRLALMFRSQICWVVVDATNFEQRKLKRWISVYSNSEFLQPLYFGGLHDIDGLTVISILSNSGNDSRTKLVKFESSGVWQISSLGRSPSIVWNITFNRWQCWMITSFNLCKNLIGGRPWHNSLKQVIPIIFNFTKLENTVVALSLLLYPSSIPYPRNF